MSRSPLALLPLSLALACNASAVDDGSEHADGRTLVQVWEPQRHQRVDLVLVIDDSPSMLNFQTNFAANLDFFAWLNGDEEWVDMRVAITTSSVPGPSCTGARARGGEPIIESCREHLQDFVGPDEHGELGGEVQDLREVCESACGLETIPRVLSPGGDEHDLHALAERPWIEAPNNPFGGNLADNVEFGEAVTCAGLQGFAGCRYESPIEAAARMVEHMHDPNHPMFEFRRPDATLSIVFISDEDDCSHPDASATIFDPSGARTFWPDPQASEAPSAVCVNASLTCNEDGCTLTDHTLAGTPTTDPEQATLTPTTRLHDALQAAGEFDLDPHVPLISILGGFTYKGELHYAQPGPDDPPEAHAYAAAFGIGPGCTAQPDLRAAPGGRLAAASTPDAYFSICEPDWSPAFTVWAERIRDIIKPACMEFECVHDLDPATTLLEPDCVMEIVAYDEARTALPECLRDGDRWHIDEDTHDYTPPDGTDACWVWLTDAPSSTQDPLTEDPNDDMSAICVDNESPGEFKIARRSPTHLPYDSVYELRCRPCAD